MMKWAAGIVLSLSLLLGGCEMLAGVAVDAVTSQVVQDKPLLDSQIGGNREGLKLDDGTGIRGDVETESMVVTVNKGIPSWILALVIILLAIPDVGTMWDRGKDKTVGLLKRRKEKTDASA